MGRERSQRSRQLLIFAGSYQRGREEPREREREAEGRSSTPTLLIKKSLSAPRSLNKKAGRTVEQNTRATQILCFLFYFFYCFCPISCSNQTTAFGEAIVLGFFFFFLPLLILHCVRDRTISLSMIHNYRNWMVCGFVRREREREEEGRGRLREKEVQEAKQ